MSNPQGLRAAGAGTSPPLTAANILDLQGRLVGAALHDPASYLPLLDPALREGLLPKELMSVVSRLGPADRRNQADSVIADLAIGSDADGQILRSALDRMAGDVGHELWLRRLQSDGVDESPGSIKAVVTKLVEDHHVHRARADLRALAAGVVSVTGDAAAGIDALADIAAATASAAQRVERTLSPTLVEAFVDSARTYGDMLRDPVPVPPSLLGNGSFRRGQLGMIHGPDGSRKSWASLHLLVEAARGGSWFGLHVPDGGLRVGLVSLEDGEEIVNARLDAIIHETGADPMTVEQMAPIITRTRFKGVMDVTKPEGVEMLRRFAQEFQLDMLIVDHLTRMHSIVDERDLFLASTPLNNLANELQLGILVLHHDRKPSSTGKPGQDLGAARGDSRFRADCRFVVGMFENRDRICLRVEKSTGGRKPAPVFLEHSDAGPLHVSDAPERAIEAAATRRTEMLAMVLKAGTDGAKPADLSQSLEVTPGTVRNYARRLERDGAIRCQGKGKAARYIAIPTQQCLALDELLSSSTQPVAVP